MITRWALCLVIVLGRCRIHNYFLLRTHMSTLVNLSVCYEMQIMQGFMREGVNFQHLIYTLYLVVQKQSRPSRSGVDINRPANQLNLQHTSNSLDL